MLIDERRYLELLEARARSPERIAAAASARKRRPFLADDGRVCIIAADHPARAALKVGSDALAMANRRDLLERLLVALQQPGVDGVLAAPDVMEDLLLLGALDQRIAIGSLNRGGLPGAVWELDDRFTAYDPVSVKRAGLDGGKMLLRLALNDAGTLPTLESCARAIDGLAEQRLLAMVEPLPATREADGTVRISKEPDDLIKVISVASGLGNTSAYTWLKVHVTQDMERVLSATTLPTLLLGGDPGNRPAEVFDGWRRALRLPQVRGLVAGRALLYPPDGNVAAAVAAAAELVHG
ncbi:MAG TPA: deoxyribose-phosphate aldolase [Gemmatimonadales bacterium]|nr:deoxyribose-phosphate aldolase [Gemmatimonadales bacterium]